MPEKKVTAIVSNDGKIAISFGGFSGNTCYTEAERIKSILKNLGISIDCENIVPNKENAEQSQIQGEKSEQKH